MNDLKALCLEYIDYEYYSSLFMNDEDDSLKIICCTEKFPDINGIKKLIKGCLKDEEKEKHIILGIVTSIDTLFKFYESHTYWNCLLLETSMKNQAQIIMDSLKLESLQQAKPCMKSYIFREKDKRYTVIEIQPDHSFMDIDLTVKTCREVFIASTEYKQKIYLPNITRNELNSIMRCMPIPPRNLSKTLIGYTSRKDHTHFNITDEYREMLQEITEAADMVIVDDRSKFSKYSRMQYSSLVTYRPLYRLTLDTNLGQYTLTEDTEWLNYKQELDDFKQARLIKKALQEFNPIGIALEQKIKKYQWHQKILKEFAEAKANQIFEKRRNQVQALMESAKAELDKRIESSQKKIDELYAEATRAKEAADRLSKITTTEFTGHILSYRGKKIFTATSSSADTKELLTALQNLGHDKDQETLSFNELKKKNEESDNASLLKTLSYYVLPVSYDLLRKEDHGYNILLNHVRQIYATKEWKINVIPVNIQELTTQEWKNMLDIYEPKIGKAQILDMTCTNNTKPALTFNDLMHEALSEQYDAHEKDTSNYRNAFTYNIFISYRQKDRLLAQSLIQRLIKDPDLKKVGFWYDVHLEAGYNFEQQIIDEIDNADMAIMLVTDNIIKPTAMLMKENGYLKGANYISQHEYPYMCSNKNLKILPVAYEMGLDDSTLNMMNEVSPSALESHGVDIGNADNYSDIVYYKEEKYGKFYAMFPKADNVEDVIPAKDEKSIKDLISKIKTLSLPKRNAFVETTENSYLRAEAYYTGTRTEKNQEEALRIWGEIYKKDKNSTYGLKAQEMLLKVYINKINENIDLVETTDKLTDLITHNLGECTKKLKSEAYFTKEFEKTQDEDLEQEDSNTPQNATEVDKWYVYHPLDQDKFHNIILTPYMEMKYFSYSSKILYMDKLSKSFLGRIQYIEQFLDWTELLYSLSHEQQTGDYLKNKANIEFYRAVTVINNDIYSAIYAMLRSLMALRTGIEIDDIKKSDVRKEDNKGHKEYAYTFKSIYSNNKIVDEYGFEVENILCTIWACLKIMQEKCLRFQMIIASKSYKAIRGITTLQDRIQKPGLKRFNILQMLAILKDAPTRPLKKTSNQLTPGPHISRNSTIKEDVQPEIYKKIRNAFDNKMNYTDSLTFEAWLNDELNKVSEQNIDIKNELNRVEKDNVDADKQEKITYRKIRFWEETYHHATRYAHTAYKKYENKYESNHQPEDLMRKSELQLVYEQYDMELTEDTLNSIFEAEQDAWSAYKYSSSQMDDNKVTSKYIRLMQNCINIFKNGIEDDAIAKDNDFLNLFLDNAREHLIILQMRNRNEANNKELCNLTEGLLSLAEHCPSRKDADKPELGTLEALKNNDITQETSRFLLERDYLNQANSRSTLYMERDSYNLARTTYNILNSSNTKKGVVANYDAYKNLRYCLSMLESEKTRGTNTEEYTYLSTIESQYRQLHDKWAFYNDDRITFIKNLSKVEKDMLKLSDDEKLEALHELMEQNSGSFKEKKWDNSDATMLSSHIGKMIKRLNSPKTEEGLYSRFISDYCYPYLNGNLENQKVFSDYIMKENQRLIDFLNNTGTDTYTVRINHMRRLMMALLGNNEYLQLQNVLDVYDLKMEYYRLSKCTPSISILPEIFEEDIPQLEEMYRLEYERPVNYNRLDYSFQEKELHSAYINPFCSDKLKNSIRNHVAFTDKKHALSIFWLFEDLLPEECKNAYKQFRSNDYDPFELINHSGIITDLKEELIKDTWYHGNVENTRMLSPLYPSIVRNIIPPHINTMRNTFYTITNTYSFIKNEEAPLLLECIKQLVECDVASILEMEITDYVYILEKIQDELNLYFPIMSPIQKSIWIRMLYMILEDQNKYRNIPGIDIKASKTSQMLTKAKAQAPLMNKQMLIWCTIYGFLNNNNYTTGAYIKYGDAITNLLNEECDRVSDFISSPKIPFKLAPVYKYDCDWDDFEDESEEQNPWNDNTISFDTSPYMHKEDIILHLPDYNDFYNEELMYSAQEAYDQFFNSTLYLRENHELIPIDQYANIVIRNFFKTYIPVLKWNSMNMEVPQSSYQSKLPRSYMLAYIRSDEVAMLNDVLNIPIMIYADRNEIIQYRKYSSYDASVNLIKHVIELNRKRIEAFELADPRNRIEKLPDSIEKFSKDDFYKIQPDLNDYDFLLKPFLETWNKRNKGDNNQS